MIRVVFEGRIAPNQQAEAEKLLSGAEFAGALAALPLRNWVVTRPLSGAYADAAGMVFNLEFEVENLAAVAAVTRSEGFAKIYGMLLEVSGGTAAGSRQFHSIIARG